MGLTGRKVVQTLPGILDASVEWEPVRDGNNGVRLKSRYGRGDRFLRANNQVPQLQNSVTHKVPSETSWNNYEWLVDIVEKVVQSPAAEPPSDTSCLESSLDNSSTSSQLEVCHFSL